MQRSILAVLTIGLFLSFFLHPALADSPEPNQDATLDGFSKQSAVTEKEWESKFRALPTPRSNATICNC